MPANSIINDIACTNNFLRGVSLNTRYGLRKAKTLQSYSLKIGDCFYAGF